MQDRDDDADNVKATKKYELKATTQIMLKDKMKKIEAKNISPELKHIKKTVERLFIQNQDFQSYK